MNLNEKLVKKFQKVMEDYTAVCKDFSDEYMFAEDRNTYFQIRNVKYFKSVIKYEIEYMDYSHTTYSERIVDDYELEDYVDFLKQCLKRAKKYAAELPRDEEDEN